jgi:hypothetical protein
MDALARLGAQAVGAASTVKPLIAPVHASAPRVTPEDDYPSDAEHHSEETAHEVRHERAEPPDELEFLLHPHSRLAARGESSARLVPAPAASAAPVEHVADVPTACPVAATERSTNTASGAERTERIEVERASATRETASFPVRKVNRETRSAALPARGDVTDSLRLKPEDGENPEPSTERSSPAPPLLAETSDGGAALLERLRSLGATAPSRPARRDPVVRVSIGRIEVRAVTPPAAGPPVQPTPLPPRPATVQPPRLTLAEYLARKPEGR